MNPAFALLSSSLLTLILIFGGCGGTEFSSTPTIPPMSMTAERDICLGHIIPIIAELTVGPTLEPCIWQDQREHVLVEYTSCKRTYFNQDNIVLKVKEDSYERWTWFNRGIVFFLKNQLKTLYFHEVNEQTCVKKFFNTNEVEDPEYYPEKMYCETVTLSLCNTGR